MKNFIAGTANAAVLAAIVGVAAFQWSDAQAEERLQAITAEDRKCLQQNIFWEARNQSTLGQVAVAWVTINRVEADRYPDSICGVVWQNRAFSWTQDGKSDTPADNVVEQRAWEDAGLVADVVLLDWSRNDWDPTQGANHYHADWIEAPYWADSNSQTVKIDNHIFYDISW